MDEKNDSDLTQRSVSMMANKGSFLIQIYRMNSKFQSFTPQISSTLKSAVGEVFVDPQTSSSTNFEWCPMGGPSYLCSWLDLMEMPSPATMEQVSTRLLGVPFKNSNE